MANYSTAQILAMEPRGRRSPGDIPGKWEPWPGRVRGARGGPCLAVGVCEENTESFQVWELGAGAHPCLASRDPAAEVLGMLAAELEKC